MRIRTLAVVISGELKSSITTHLFRFLLEVFFHMISIHKVLLKNKSSVVNIFWYESSTIIMQILVQ